MSNTPFVHQGRAANCACKKEFPDLPVCIDCKHVLVNNTDICEVCGRKTAKKIAEENNITLEIQDANQSMGSQMQ